MRQNLHLFSACVMGVMGDPGWSKHAEAVQADPALQQAIVRVLLDRCLPGIAAQAAGGVDLLTIQLGASRLALALATSAIEAAALQHFQQQEGAAAAAAEAAGSILQSLPAQPPGAEEPRRWAETWAESMHLAGMVTCLAVAAVAPGSSSKGSSSRAGQWREWQGVAACVHAVPYIVTALQAAGSHGPPGSSSDAQRSWFNALAVWCSNLKGLLMDSHRLRQRRMALEAWPMWLRAAAAGIQAQPLLVQLHAAFSLLPDTDLHPAAGQLAAEFMQLTTRTLPFVHAAEHTALSALQADTQCCQRTAFALQPDNPQGVLRANDFGEHCVSAALRYLQASRPACTCYHLLLCFTACMACAACTAWYMHAYWPPLHSPVQAAARQVAHRYVRHALGSAAGGCRHDASQRLAAASQRGRH